MFKIGDQDPDIPFSDVFGKELSEAPEQIGDTAANAGVTIGLTGIVNV